MGKYTHDLIVIGAGSAGLTAAGGCAMLGLRVALVERGEMGGDCLNTGCVPSKALLAAAAQAQAVRDAARYGVAAQESVVDFAAVMAHVHGAIATIAPEDSQERFEEMGCEVFRSAARFTGTHEMTLDNGTVLSAPRIVLAVGSKPFVPPVAGIEDIDYLTSENLWELRELPEHLIVLGGGPIGMEMAQAFRRLGAQVTVVTDGAAMEKDDPDAAAVVIERLRAEGVTILTGQTVEKASSEGGVTLQLAGGDRVTGSHLLIATGRTFDGKGLDLDRAGIVWDEKGITVDARRRTNRKHIYALGDCRPGPHFTHASGYEGSNAVLEIALGLPSKTNYAALPWVTYTDPELAQVGMQEAEARRKFGDKVSVWCEDFAHNDRAVSEGETAGFVKLVKKGRKLIGATVVGSHAGEMVLPLAMAIAGKSSTFGIASLIVPYPNRSEHSKAAAFQSHEGLVFNGATKRWAKFLARLRR